MPRGLTFYFVVALGPGQSLIFLHSSSPSFLSSTFPPYPHVLFVARSLVVAVRVVLAALPVAFAAAGTFLILALLADGDLDALRGEALAQLGALAHTREFLGRINLKGFAEDLSQHLCLAFD